MSMSKHLEGLPFEDFIANHMRSCSEPHFKNAAINVNDTLYLARLICIQNFRVENPDPIDVIAVFKAIMTEAANSRDREEREQVREDDRFHERYDVTPAP